MQLLKDLIDIDLLNRDISDGYVSLHVHPTANDLRILNYTQKTQFAGHWTDATRKTRGLIIRDSQPLATTAPSVSNAATISELAWAKFFTAEQAMASDWGKLKLIDEENQTVVLGYAELDIASPVSVTEKLDGSLAIAYRLEGAVNVATRGSFNGLQAVAATQWLHAHPAYATLASILHSTVAQPYTFLFEWIGPDNPIVLPYPENKLVFLGAINRESGRYEGTESWATISKHIEAASALPARTLAEALALPISDAQEGFVVRYLNRGIHDQIAMIKIKGSYYIKLHRAMYSLTTGSIYELVRVGGIAAIEQIASGLPTPVIEPLLAYAQELAAAHHSLLEEARTLNEKIESALAQGYTQKDYALAAQAYGHLKSLLFILHASHDNTSSKLNDLAWRMLKPQQSELVLGIKHS